MMGPQLRRALTAAVKLTLTRQERHDFAEFLVGHEGSWNRMPEEDAKRVADALFAFPAVQWLVRERGPDRPPIDRPLSLKRSA